MQSEAKRAAPLAVALILGVATALAAQEATERYIPVGASPGVSGVSTYLGPVVRADERARTVTVEDDGALRTIRIQAGTRIWLDRSRLREASQIGSFSDLRVGRTVEVKYTDEETADAADWIKVRIDGD